MMAITGGQIDSQVNEALLKDEGPRSSARANPIITILNIDRILISFCNFMARKLNPD
jgi:hypothetical protein